MNRRQMLESLVLIVVVLTCRLAACTTAGATDLQVSPTFELSVAGATVRAPASGLWMIGTGWAEETYEIENHGVVQSASLQRGSWHVVRGHVDTPDGRWDVEDQYRSLKDGLVQGKRRWKYTGEKPSGPVVLTIRFDVESHERRTDRERLRPFLPGINYFGNPSGTRVAAERVPTWTGEIGCAGMYEEHRYPLPFASVESDQSFVAALHSRPSPVPFAARDDLWWSLGLIQNKNGVELRLQSGPVASNGERGVVKARQKNFLPYPDAHMDGVAPGSVIEKFFYLQLASNQTNGHGFHLPLWTSIDLFDARPDRSLPKTTDVMWAKMQDTFDRWHEDERCRGFRTRPPQAQPWFMMGWADRAEAPGYALQALKLDEFSDSPDLWRRRAMESLDFLVKSPSQKQPKNADFSIVYDYQQHRWLPQQNILSQSQALDALADAIEVAAKGNEAEREAAERWRRFLSEKVTRIADTVLADEWRPVSTNEAFAIAPLIKSGKLLGAERLTDAARKIADHAIMRHQSMTEPYWGGTLDARCEDKEGAWAAMQGYCSLYDATNEPKYLEAAIHATDVVLSYLYVWDVALPPGRLADHAFKTRGWTSVSVQNQHLDVFGVLFTPELWQLGRWTGDERYQQIAKLMFVSAGQMTNLANGVQGEQMFQTNYQQHDAGDDVKGMRGGYAEVWNIYWISAHFLTAAAKLEQLGIDWRSF